MGLPHSDDGPLDSWQEHAACRNTRSDVFFPISDNPSSLAAALRYCNLCAVADACLEYAITTGSNEGIWGGAAPIHRRRANPITPPWNR